MHVQQKAMMIVMLLLLLLMMTMMMGLEHLFYEGRLSWLGLACKNRRSREELLKYKYLKEAAKRRSSPLISVVPHDRREIISI